MGLKNWFNRNFNVERDSKGNFSYWLDSSNNFGNNQKYLQQSLDNVIAFICISARANLYSQMKITHKDSNGDVIQDSPYVKLLQKPNYFQSGVDFLKQQMWNLSATGNDLIYQKKIVTSDVPVALYNLIPGDIDYNDINKVNSFVSLDKDIRQIEKQTIQYTLDGKTFNLPISDLIPFYDVSNALKSDKFFESPSRLEALQKNLCNIEENIKAKNINLQFSQKFLATNKTSSQGTSMPLDEKDRETIEKIVHSKSLQITSGYIEFQHLVSDMKRLFLDEQLSYDAKIVAMAFEQNEDVLNFALNKGATYENQEYGNIRYIQGSIQNDADNTMNTLMNKWGFDQRGETLEATYSHLPIMQKLMKEKILTLKDYQEALKLGMENGTVTQEEAIEKTANLSRELGL